MIKSIAGLLHTLHEAGFVHGSLSPRSVLFLPNSDAWTFADLTHLTPCNQQSIPSHCLFYAAPEVIHCAVQGAAVTTKRHLDAWALGVIVFELLTGKSWALPVESSLENVRTVRNAPSNVFLECSVWILAAIPTANCLHE